LGGALLVLCDAGIAATATASVNILQTGDPGTPNSQTFAGVGNDRLRAAAGEYGKGTGTTSGSATAGGGKISTFASAFFGRRGDARGCNVKPQPAWSCAPRPSSRP
jgi:hypothetical protein